MGATSDDVLAEIKDQTPGVIRGAQPLVNLNIRPTQRDRRHSAL